MELINELIGDLCTLSNVLRHIHVGIFFFFFEQHVGMLCVQQRSD